MEFTYNEFVRYGFGFYNPNHAAALICSIFPFLWNWKRFILIGWAFSAILIAPLYLTYSRTGFVVLFIELIISIFICKYRIRKFFIGVAFLLLATIIASPLGERFALDGSLMNRPKIWLAGLQIFATNPHGVGFGNSGELVSTFLLQNISCRTLVNSHLTLLTEGGIVVSFVCFFFIASAIINGNKKSSSWCAFLGLTISAFTSTIFDFSLLFDFNSFGNLSLLNFVLSWLLLLVYLGMGIFLIVKSHSKAHIVLSLLTVCSICFMPLVLKSDLAPIIRNGSAVKKGENISYVIRDDDWRIRDVLPFVKSGYVIPLKPFDIPNKISSESTIWLFGNAAEYASRFSESQLVFVSPPEFFDLPKNTKKVYTKQFVDERELKVPVIYY